MSLVTELKRRNVFKVVIAYIVMAWLVMQVADVILNNIEAPSWVFQAILLLLGIGFLLVLFFSWTFELTPEGLKKESEVDRSQSITDQTGRKLNKLIFTLMALAIAYFAYDKFVLDASRDAALVEATTQAVTEQVAAEVTASEFAAPESDQALLEADKSIAVLPFADMSANQDQEYLSDGLAEELLNLLARIPELKVAARTSSFSFKGQNKEIPEIAERLNVAHVLEGSVRTSGNRVRITAQLIQAGEGYHLWSETFDRELDDIFAIQDEIAAAVVEQLKVTLLGKAPLVQKTDPQAYALFLQAQQLGHRSSEASLALSNELYKQVLELDPNYTAAWNGLASNYLELTTVGTSGPADARKAANQALAIDSNDASALSNLAYVAHTFDGDFKTAARYLERALASEPGNVEILRSAANLYRQLGRLDRAIAVSEHMISLDTVNNNAWYTHGVMKRFQGDLDEAIAAFEMALSLSPSRVGVHYGIGEALLLKGEPEAALAAMQQENSIWKLIGMPLVYHALGRAEESDRALAELISQYEREASANIAYIHAYRGEVDAAFEWLDKAVQYNDPGVYDLPIETLFANLHEDPRWLPFLERVGNAPSQLDAIEFEVKLPGQ